MSIVYLLITLVVIVIALDRLAPLTAARWAMQLDRRRAGMRLASANIPGFTMPYLEGGSGEPLILVHGFGADKDNFTRIARYLRPHYRVICPDLPGFGAATRDAAARYGIDEQVARLHAFITTLNLGRVHLGGSSMGGYIVAQFCATYPHLVGSVWLLDPAGTAASHSTEIIKHYRTTGDMPLLVPHVERFPALLAAVMSQPPFFPHSVKHALAQRAVADYPLHKAILIQFAVESPLLETRYPSIPTPALIVWGSEDKVLHPDGATSFQSLFPASTVRLMPGIGHLPMLEAPKETALDYLTFRRSLS